MLCCLLFHWSFSFLSTIPLFEMANNQFSLQNRFKTELYCLTRLLSILCWRAPFFLHALMATVSFMMLMCFCSLRECCCCCFFLQPNGLIVSGMLNHYWQFCVPPSDLKGSLYLMLGDTENIQMLQLFIHVFIALFFHFSFEHYSIFVGTKAGRHIHLNIWMKYVLCFSESFFFF